MSYALIFQDLPVIPFTYPTAVIAEKLSNKKKEAKKRPKNPSGESNKSASSPRTIKRANSRTDLDFHMDHGDEFGPSSLENIVNIAERELASESLRQGHGFGEHKPSPKSIWRLGHDDDYDDPDPMEEDEYGMNKRYHDFKKSPAATSIRRNKAAGDFGSFRDRLPDGYFEMNQGGGADTPGSLRDLPPSVSRLRRDSDSSSSEQHFEMDLGKNWNGTMTAVPVMLDKHGH